MLDINTTALPVNYNTREFFALFMAYLEMKTYAMLLKDDPLLSVESFEQMWPGLLDQMLGTATQQTVSKLSEIAPLTDN